MHSTGPTPPYNMEPIPEEEKRTRLWGMLCHLTALSAYVGIPFGHILGPLLIWQIKKNDVPGIDAHGKEALNFQLSMTIYGIAAFVLSFFLIGFLVLIAVAVFNLAMVITASIKANDGDFYRYPLCIRFLT